METNVEVSEKLLIGASMEGILQQLQFWITAHDTTDVPMVIISFMGLAHCSWAPIRAPLEKPKKAVECCKILQVQAFIRSSFVIFSNEGRCMIRPNLLKMVDGRRSIASFGIFKTYWMLKALVSSPCFLFLQLLRRQRPTPHKIAAQV